MLQKHIIFSFLIRILILYSVIEVGCKITKANEEIANLTKALESQSNANTGKYKS